MDLKGLGFVEFELGAAIQPDVLHSCQREFDRKDRTGRSAGGIRGRTEDAIDPRIRKQRHRRTKGMVLSFAYLPPLPNSANS